MITNITNYFLHLIKTLYEEVKIQVNFFCIITFYCHPLQSGGLGLLGLIVNAFAH